MKIIRFKRAPTLSRFFLAIALLAAVATCPAAALGASSASGSCGGVTDSRTLSVSITAPSSAVIGRSVSVDVNASGGGVFGQTVVANVVVSDGSVQSSSSLSGNYTASTGFDFLPDRVGAITITAVVTDQMPAPLCAIAPLTVNTVVQVSAAPAGSSTASQSQADTTAPTVTAVQRVTGRVGSIARFKYRVSSGGSATQEALAIYRRGASKAVSMMVTKWGRNTGVRGVRWRLPASLRPGTYTWCVVSKDSSGNIGDDNGGCAKLIVTA
jgi:hypothetical protein